MWGRWKWTSLWHNSKVCHLGQTGRVTVSHLYHQGLTQYLDALINRKFRRRRGEAQCDKPKNAFLIPHVWWYKINHRSWKWRHQNPCCTKKTLIYDNDMYGCRTGHLGTSSIILGKCDHVSTLIDLCSPSSNSLIRKNQWIHTREKKGLHAIEDPLDTQKGDCISPGMEKNTITQRIVRREKEESGKK